MTALKIKVTEISIAELHRCIEAWTPVPIWPIWQPYRRFCVLFAHGLCKFTIPREGIYGQALLLILSGPAGRLIGCIQQSWLELFFFYRQEITTSSRSVLRWCFLIGYRWMAAIKFMSALLVWAVLQTEVNEGKYRPAKEFSIKCLRVQLILTQTLKKLQLSNNNCAMKNMFFFIEISSNLWLILLFYMKVFLTILRHDKSKNGWMEMEETECADL